MVVQGHCHRLVERHALLAVAVERQQQQGGQQQEGEEAPYKRMAPEQRGGSHELVEYRHDEEREQRRNEESADHDGRQRALYLGSGRGGDGHRYESERGDQSGEEYGPQQVLRAACDDAARREWIGCHVPQIVEVVNHQNAVENGHAEERNESHAGGDAERKPAQPQRQDASDDRERHGGEDHQRVGHALEGEEEQQQDQHQRDGNDDGSVRMAFWRFSN